MKTEIELKFPVLDMSSVLALGLSNADPQRNHYFQPSNGLSVRTRQTGNDPAELVAKKGADPVNGTERIEYTISTGETIEVLDRFVEDIMGLPVWAKWARVRYSFCLDDFDLCFDDNSGYGPILEIEGNSEKETRRFASDKLGLTYALTAEDLKAFTDEYVANWKDYYYPFLHGDRTVLKVRKELDERMLG